MRPNYLLFTHAIGATKDVTLEGREQAPLP